MVSMVGLFARKIGIDLGTANTIIYAKGRGVVLNEPTVVALKRYTGEVLAVGQAAQNMIGRAPEEIVIVKPIRDGVISNFNTTKIMLREFISRLYPRSFIPLQALVSVSLKITEIEKRAVMEATRQAGAKNVFIVENSIAGALGINLPIEDNAASMLVDIGGGTSEAAVISLGGIVSKKCVSLGGEQFSESIRHYIRKKYNFLVGERTAEAIKIRIGAALPESDQRLEVGGTDLINRMPGKLNLSSREISGVFTRLITSIIQAVKKTLEITPIELMDDIMLNGIIMTGGGALLKGLPQAVAGEVKMAVTLADQPLESVALGTGKMLSSLSMLKKLA